MKFNVITIFPKIISDYCDETILNRAQKNNLIQINPVNLRDFTDDNHKTVDDTPYGGGAGMVMKPEPIYKALKSLDDIPFHKDDGFTKSFIHSYHFQTIFSTFLLQISLFLLKNPEEFWEA